MATLILIVNLLASMQAQAFSWRDLWLTPDQQASDHYQKGEHKQAERLFTRDDWRGMAAYRQGHYAAAEKQFDHDKDPSGYYNLGNALAKQGKYQQALAAYQKSLELSPNDKDAAFNRDLMKKLLKQQKSSNSKQSKKDQKDKKQQGNSKQKNKQKKKGNNKQKSKQQQQTSQQNKEKQRQQDSQDKGKKQDPKEGEKSKPQAADNKQAKGKGQGKQDSQKAKGQKKNKSSSKQAANERELKQLEKQWLRQIPSQPMGLLQQKFQRDYDKRHSQRQW